MATRREFIKWTAASGVGLAVAGRGLLDGRASAAPMATSVASALTPYLDPMPLLVDSAFDATGLLLRPFYTRILFSQLSATGRPARLRRAR